MRNSGETGRKRFNSGGVIDGMATSVASKRTERLAQPLNSPLGAVNLLLNVVDQKEPK